MKYGSLSQTTTMHTNILNCNNYFITNHYTHQLLQHYNNIQHWENIQLFNNISSLLGVWSHIHQCVKILFSNVIFNRNMILCITFCEGTKLYPQPQRIMIIPGEGKISKITSAINRMLNVWKLQSLMDLKIKHHVIISLCCNCEKLR